MHPMGIGSVGAMDSIATLYYECLMLLFVCTHIVVFRLLHLPAVDAISHGQAHAR